MKISNKEKKLAKRATFPILAFSLVIICLVFLVLERADEVGEISHLLGSLFLVFIGVYLVREAAFYREHALSYVYQAFYFLGLMVSAIVISDGAYMIEIQEAGSPNGTFWLLAIFFLSGYEASKFSYLKSKKLVGKTPVPRIDLRVEKSVSMFLVVPLIMLCFYVLWKYSSPVFLGMERSTFWATVVPGSYSFVQTLVIQTFFLALAVYWLSFGGIKIVLMAVVVSYLVITVLVLGQKLSAFVIHGMTACFFVAAFNPNFRVSAKSVFWALLAVLGIFILIVFSYKNIGRDAEFIISRVALQSQLLWSVLNVKDFVTAQESWECFLGCGAFENGKDFISFKFVPESLYFFYKESGTGFSGFMPALPILTLGMVPALIIHVAVSFLGGAIQCYLINILRSRSILFGFLVFKLHFAIVLFWYTGLPLGPVFILSILICLIFLMIKKASQKPSRGVWSTVGRVGGETHKTL